MNPFLSFEGFPRGTRLLPVPAPLLGTLLEQIDDVAELKCTLRFFWYLAQAKGSPKAVDAVLLETDEVLLAVLGSKEAVQHGLGQAVARGTLLNTGGWYLLHTPDNARAAKNMGAAPARGNFAGHNPEAKPNIFALYEANIGLLTPLVADQLRDAEGEYPPEWIEEAFREAAEQNKRSWRYIATILERWATEGRGERKQGQRTRGEPGRHSETLTAAEYLRRYGLPRRVD